MPWGLLVAVDQTHLDAEAGGSGHPEEFACCTAAPCLCMILFSLFSLSVTCLLFRLEVSATSQTKLSLCFSSTSICLLGIRRNVCFSPSHTKFSQRRQRPPDLRLQAHGLLPRRRSGVRARDHSLRTNRGLHRTTAILRDDNAPKCSPNGLRTGGILVRPLPGPSVLFSYRSA